MATNYVVSSLINAELIENYCTKGKYYTKLILVNVCYLPSVIGVVKPIEATNDLDFGIHPSEIELDSVKAKEKSEKIKTN